MHVSVYSWKTFEKGNFVWILYGIVSECKLSSIVLNIFLVFMFLVCFFTPFVIFVCVLVSVLVSPPLTRGRGPDNPEFG